ncbi:MAG: hypothetical protein AB1403_00030 [Candidatus Riflebacteria bacterium]
MEIDMRQIELITSSQNLDVIKAVRKYFSEDTGVKLCIDEQCGLAKIIRSTNDYSRVTEINQYDNSDDAVQLFEKLEGFYRCMGFRRKSSRESLDYKFNYFKKGWRIDFFRGIPVGINTRPCVVVCLLKKNLVIIVEYEQFFGKDSSYLNKVNANIKEVAEIITLASSSF